MGVTWHGLDTFKRELATLPVDVTAAASPVVQSAAEDAAAVMRARYPFVTGRLRDSTLVHENTEKRTDTRVSWDVTNAAPYAHFVEYGTRYTSARPVFIPTRNQHQRRMDADIVSLFQRFNLTARGRIDR